MDFQKMNSMMSTFNSIQRFQDDQERRNAPPKKYDMMQDRARSMQVKSALDAYRQLSKGADEASRDILDENMKSIYSFMTPVEKAESKMIAASTIINPRRQKMKWYMETNKAPVRPNDTEDLHGMADYMFKVDEYNNGLGIFMGDEPKEPLSIVPVNADMYAHKTKAGNISFHNVNQVETIRRIKDLGSTLTEVLANNGKINTGKPTDLTLNGVKQRAQTNIDAFSMEKGVKMTKLGEVDQEVSSQSIPKLPADIRKMLVNSINPDSDEHEALFDAYKEGGVKALKQRANDLSGAIPGWTFCASSLPRPSWFKSQSNEYRSSKFRLIPIPTEEKTEVFGEKVYYDPSRKMCYDAEGTLMGSPEEAEEKLAIQYIKDGGRRTKGFTIQQALEDKEKRMRR